MARVLCLLYHRINRIKDTIFNLTATPEEFENQIIYLKENYDILRFEDDWENCERDSIVITFDDGYADNCIYALPVLEKYGVPATIFVSTGNIGTFREFWWDEFGRLLTAGENYPETFELKDSLYHYCWETKSCRQREELVKTLRWLVRMEPDSKRTEDWTAQLRQWSGIGDANGREANLSLNVEQLHRLDSSSYITIGAHTVNHLSLGALSKENQEREIVSSIEYLQSALKKKINFFSYPFGSGLDYNTVTLEICRSCGIQKAATTQASVWRGDMDPLKLPRFSIKDGNLIKFKADIEQFMGGKL